MTAAVQADIDAVQIRTLDVYLDNVFLGLIREASLKLTVENATTTVSNALQLEGVIKSVERARIPKLEMTFMSSSQEFLRSQVWKDRVDIDTNGADTTFYFGNENKDLVTLSSEVRLHPSSLDLDNKSEDFLFYKGVIQKDALELLFSREDTQDVDVEMIIFPDTTKSTNREYGYAGPGTSQQVPLTVFIQNSKTLASTPPMHSETQDMEEGDVFQLEAWAMNGSDASITLDINNGAGYAGTRAIVSMAFDALSPVSSLVAGQYIKGTAGTEWMYVSSVTYATTSTGTMVVVREVAGSVIEAYSDNNTLTVQSDIGFQRVTDIGAWASSVVADVTVGDSSATNNKGLATWVSSGTSNITCTENTKASLNYVITTT